MTAIHLNMMKLEGNGERGTEEATAITPPHQHGIAKQICVLIHDAIKFCSYHRRRSNHHCVLYGR